MTALQALEQPSRHRLTVEDFLLLADSGAFAQNSRTELIEGEIFAMNSIGRWHSILHSRLNTRLAVALEDAGLGLEPMIAPTVLMPPDSAPEPDIALAREPAGDGYIALASIGLAIEVSVSTLDFDLKRKLRVYGRNAIPEYWVVDVEGRKIIQFWSPRGDSYAERAEIALGTDITAATLPGLTIATDGLI